MLKMLWVELLSRRGRRKSERHRKGQTDRKRDSSSSDEIKSGKPP